MKLSKTKLKEIKKLRQKKYRLLENKYIIEGEHLINEAKSANIKMDIYELDELDTKDLKEISSLESPSDLLAVCDINNKKELIGTKYLLLDEIQDPGNLGTIIRSALAFNIDTVVLGDNTVDLYNEKVIRSTQGSMFHINIINMNLKDTIQELKNKNITIYGTNVVNGKDLKSIKNHDNYAIVMGNEGRGLSNEIEQICDCNIYIKTNDLSESLNVAMATSIILYEFDK